MSRRIPFVGVLAFAVVFSVPGSVLFANENSQPPKVEDSPAGRHVKARLVLDRAVLTPGDSAQLGVVFDIEKNWHIFWRNPGQVGDPPRVDLKLPEGITAGEPQWPAPERHIDAGSLLSFVHRDRLVIVYPLTITEDVKAGKPAVIKADVEWTECRTVCMTERTSIAQEFPVEREAKPSEDARLIEAALRRVPERGREGSAFEATWVGTTLMLQAKGAKKMEFFPRENEQDVQPENLKEKGVSKSDSMAISWPASVRTLSRVTGVLAVEREGRQFYYEVDVAAPAGEKAEE